MPLLSLGTATQPRAASTCSSSLPAPPLYLRLLLLGCLPCDGPSSAVAGQDSDFFIMQGICYLPLEFLKVTGVGDATEVTGKVFTADRVADALQLPTDRLHELAWLVGNDHSSDLLDRYKVADVLGIPVVDTKTKGRRCTPQSVAKYLAALGQGVPLAEQAALAALDTSQELAQSLLECRRFYSGTAAEANGGAAGDGADADARVEPQLDALLLKGLQDTNLPGWVLAVHRRRIYVSSVKTESIFPDAESEVDLVLRPLRRAMYSLLVGGGSEGGGDGKAVVTERVRVGHTRTQVPVECIAQGDLAHVLPCGGAGSSLALLRQADERSRHQVRLPVCLLRVPIARSAFSAWR